MTQIIVDEALRSKLNGLNAEIELRDSSGKTIGHFLRSTLIRNCSRRGRRRVFRMRRSNARGNKLADVRWRKSGKASRCGDRNINGRTAAVRAHD
jgi:hypothetical protein